MNRAARSTTIVACTKANFALEPKRFLPSNTDLALLSDKEI
ncbi:hypothetical protein SAMN05518849_12137 [Sphingobium sp. AP50]|nr:hypothetical protein SAMN05518849_12137 [Sphingobium sp. AP50]